MLRMTESTPLIRRYTHVVFAFAILLIAAASCGAKAANPRAGGTAGSPDGGGTRGRFPATIYADGESPDGPGAGDDGSGGPPPPFIDAGMVPASNRVDINMGVTPWKFLINSNPANAQAPTFNDAAWAEVGIPHTWNDADTFVNGPSGGGTMLGGTNWYRKHFTLDSTYATRRILLEFEGVHIGTRVFVNGTFMPGNSAVTADAVATHVIGFIPFVLDITKQVQFGGADNVIAVEVSMNAGGFYEDPGFSEVFRFGQADGGIFRPVTMHVVDPVHIPQNVYSVLNTWGTYVGTTAIAGADAGTAMSTATSATLKLQTNVQNDGMAAQNVTVSTEVVDATGTVVATATSTNMVPPSGGPAGGMTAPTTVVFDPDRDGRQPDALVSEQQPVREAVHVPRVAHRSGQRSHRRRRSVAARHPDDRLGHELPDHQRTPDLPAGRGRPLRLSSARDRRPGGAAVARPPAARRCGRQSSGGAGALDVEPRVRQRRPTPRHHDCPA